MYRCREHVRRSGLTSILGSFICLVALLLMAGCEAIQNSGALGVSDIEFGMASWYGEEFHDRITANGERYDMNKFTAAHRTLPFGTLVQVRTITNGRTVVVRINDRGPWKRNRVIDLSYAAAEKIRMLKAGVARVRLDIIDEQTGLASWYGKRFHGRLTASGKKFDMNQLTAAHRSLPFGTMVRVTNVENGKTVIVRINDRTPKFEKISINLSRRAAEELDMLKGGTARVIINVIKPEAAAKKT